TAAVKEAAFAVATLSEPLQWEGVDGLFTAGKAHIQTQRIAVGQSRQVHHGSHLIIFIVAQVCLIKQYIYVITFTYKILFVLNLYYLQDEFIEHNG
ncbi:hypothetical protein QU995_15525, partial [Escherichia coli]|nr:hypothetical protein [Escherichia coli]